MFKGAPRRKDSHRTSMGLVLETERMPVREAHRNRRIAR